VLAEAKVMTGPRDEIAAAGRGHLRASHADREQVIDVLKAAFVEGRLTRDEFDARLARAFASQTYADLATATADLPAGMIAAQLAMRPARAQAPENRAIKSGLLVISAGTMLAAGAWAAAWLTSSTELVVMAIVITIASVGSLLLAGAVMLESRHSNRSGGPLRPGRDGRGLQGRPPGDTDRDPALPEAGPDRTRTDMPAHSSWPGRPDSSRWGPRAPRGISPVLGAA
jgi:hypothetical protein